MSCQELYCLFLHSDILLFLLLHDEVFAAGLASPQDAQDVDCDGGDGDNQVAGHLRGDRDDNFHQLALVIGQLKEIILSDQKKLTNKPYYCAVCYIFYYQTCENTEQLVVCQFVDIKLFQIMHSLSAVTRLFNSVITALGYTGRGGREAHSMNFVTLLSSPSIYIQAIWAQACACWIRSAAS